VGAALRHRDDDAEAGEHVRAGIRTTDTLMDTLSVDAAAAAAQDLWERVVGAAA